MQIGRNYDQKKKQKYDCDCGRNLSELKQGKEQLNCTINKGRDNLTKVKLQFCYSLYLTANH